MSKENPEIWQFVHIKNMNPYGRSDLLDMQKKGMQILFLHLQSILLNLQVTFMSVL